MQDNVYTQENYTKLLDTLKNIRQKSLEKTNQNKEHIQKIYDALNIIEKECEFKPSYKNFINKIISDENLEKAKNEIIDDLEQLEMHGFNPDMKILISKMCTDENIQIVKDNFIKQFKALNI